MAPTHFRVVHSCVVVEEGATLLFVLWFELKHGLATDTGAPTKKKEEKTHSEQMDLFLGVVPSTGACMLNTRSLYLSTATSLRSLSISFSFSLSCRVHENMTISS